MEPHNAGAKMTWAKARHLTIHRMPSNKSAPALEEIMHVESCRGMAMCDAGAITLAGRAKRVKVHFFRYPLEHALPVPSVLTLTKLTTPVRPRLYSVGVVEQMLCQVTS